MAEAPRDQNHVTAALGVSSTDATLTLPFLIDEITGRLLVDLAGGGTGTVTSVSVVTANGFAGTVATATTTPAITITTTVTGILLGNGTSVSAASTTGSGAVVLATSPTLVTPNLGTPTTLVLTSATGLPIDGGTINTLPATRGGTGQSTYTKGDLLASPGSNTLNKLAVGADGTVLTADAASTNGVKWSAVPGASLTVGTSVISGGTNTRILYDNSGILGEYTLTGTGTVVVMATSPTLVTPVLGVATATSINKVAITAPATSATLTIADGKTFTSSSTFTVTGTDGKGINVGAATSGTFLIGDGTNMVLSTSTIPSSAGATANKVLRSDGTNYVLSTPTIPLSSAPAAGKVMVGDGTNWVASTPTFPNASATSGKFIISDGTNWIASTPTIPNTAGTSGKILISDGTNYISSTPTFPNASATTRKIIVSDGTNWVASTETYAVPGTSGNVLTSDGTNWTSGAPVVTASNTVTFTNKFITPQVQSVADAGGTFTPVSITNDMGIMTALSQATTIAAPTGSPVQGEKLTIRIKDNGTARALTWNAIYRASSDLALPTTTILSKTMYCGFIYNSTDTKWDLVAFLNNF